MRAGLIYATNFLLTVAIGVIFVFIEDVQTARSLTDAQIGLVVASGFATSLIAQLSLSPLADRGRVLPLAVFALVTGVAGPIGFAFSTGAATLAISRGVSGMALGVFGLLARKALLGLDATGGGAKLGILLSTNIGGFILGPMVGAIFEPLGFAAPFLVVSAAIAVAGIPATLTILRTDIAVTSVDYSDLGRLLRRPRVQAAMIVQVVVMGFIGVFDVIIDRLLTDLGASTQAVAVVVLLVGAPMLVLPRIAGNLAESRGGTTVMLPAVLVLIPAMMGYGLTGSVVMIALFGMMHGSGESFATISAQVLALEVTGPQRAAVGAGLLEAAGLSSAAICAGIAPSVYGAGGPRTLFVGAALIGLVLCAAAQVRARQGYDEPVASPTAAPI